MTQAPQDTAPEVRGDPAGLSQASWRRRNMALLTTAQMLYYFGISIDLTLTSLAGYRLAPVPQLATLPFALISVVSWLATYPASGLMKRQGRRAGFMVGSAAAIVGGAASVTALFTHQFVLFCFGVGCIGFSPLAQGMLTDKYVKGVPEDSRGAKGGSLKNAFINDATRERVRALAAIAKKRDQTLAQMALAWALRDPRMTTVLIGASSVGQLEQNVGALQRLDFTDDELAAIDQHAVDSGIDLWEAPRLGTM